MTEYDKYLNVVRGECIGTFDEKLLRVGEKYRLGVRYNPVVRKEVYYLLDVKNAFGVPIYVEIESNYFELEELSSISFIMS